MFFDEKIVQSTTNPNTYGIVVLNPDGSRIGGGSVQTTTYTLVAYYDNTDTTFDYEYYCEADPGTALTASLWRIFRIKNNKAGQLQAKEWAGTGFNRQATDLATVQSYTYS